MNTYTVGQFARIVGVSVKTLQRWDREKRLCPARTPTQRRIYSDENIKQVLGIQHPSSKRQSVVYLRVSSQSQKPDLRKQRKTVEEFCVARGYTVDVWIEEIGGGLNFKRPKFLDLIDKIVSGAIELVVIAHQDRLARFGFDLLVHLCVVADCHLVVMNTESLSPSEEMTQDLMTIVHCFSARLYGLRNYKKQLKEALK